MSSFSEGGHDFLFIFLIFFPSSSSGSGEVLDSSHVIEADFFKHFGIVDFLQGFHTDDVGDGIVFRTAVEGDNFLGGPIELREGRVGAAGGEPDEAKVMGVIEDFQHIGPIGMGEDGSIFSLSQLFAAAGLEFVHEFGPGFIAVLGVEEEVGDVIEVFGREIK